MSNLPPSPMVELEEEVYRYDPFDNGVGPMWCFGNTCLVRHKGTALLSGVERIPDAQPLNNIRWTLYKRSAKAWELQYRDVDRTREPSPIGVFKDGRLFVYDTPQSITASPRAGCSPSSIIDMLGEKRGTMRYARIKLDM